LNVLYSCDDKYAPYAGISITSLFETNKELPNITVFILGLDISDENKQKFKMLADNYNRNISIIAATEIDRYLESKDVVLLGNCRATYYRLYAAEVLPKEISRVLYLDCDIIIVGSLADLDKLEFEEYKSCAMVCYNNISNNWRKVINIDKNCLYYNAGVMLIDIVRWKDYKCSERIFMSIKKYGRYFIFAVDQDIVNSSINTNIQSLPMEYNVLTDWYNIGFKSYYRSMKKTNNILYGRENLEKAVNNPKILHYCGYKPWHYKLSDKDQCKNIYLDVKKASLWNDLPQVEYINKKLLVKIRTILYALLPQKITYYISNATYAIYLWFYYQRNKKHLR
jgi:lipopolysaccharide biosynthesis glycosyltransferase